ncbi:hypothetical protein [Paludisphaera sp.]|uniref:hypothetical protein n=1 Tax=Paludisphaera sp. TaxID=2017432 RepID=UPI00301BDC56
MIQLGDMHLAREMIRQRVVLDVTTDVRVTLSPDGVLPEMLAIDPTLTVNDLIRGMRNLFEARNLPYWVGAHDAILRVMTDDQLQDWRLLSMTWVRLSRRLMDRIVRAAGADSAKFVGSIESLVETTGCALDAFRSAIGYESSADAEREALWRTRFDATLDDQSGPEEEADAYASAPIEARERTIIDRWFARNMPPLGMKYTVASIALDAFDRYGRRAGGDARELRTALRKASEAVDFAVGFNGL